METPAHPTRKQSSVKWFQKYIVEHPQRSQAWRTGLLGEDGWLSLVPTKIYPKWARTGTRKRLFKCHIKKYARERKSAEAQETDSDENCQKTDSDENRQEDREEAEPREQN